MDELNGKISELLGQYKAYFNPYWGEILRAGFDESRYAEQVEKYALYLYDQGLGPLQLLTQKPTSGPTGALCPMRI